MPIGNKLIAQVDISLMLWVVRMTNTHWMLCLTHKELSNCSCAFPLFTMLKYINTKQSELKRDNILYEQSPRSQSIFLLGPQHKGILVPIHTNISAASNYQLPIILVTQKSWNPASKPYEHLHFKDADRHLPTLSNFSRFGLEPKVPFQPGN